MSRITNEMIEAAITGFEAQKKHIDGQIAELRGMLSGSSSGSATVSRTVRGRRKFSPEAIQRMREAQQRRWAKVRGTSVSAKKETARPKTAKSKRRLSAAGRKRIVDALKKRWAEKKASEAAAAKKKVA